MITTISAYPEVKVYERDINNEIKNIWQGYRTCYSNDFSYDDAYPVTIDDFNNEELASRVDKVILSLRDAYINARLNSLMTIQTIAKKYNYESITFDEFGEDADTFKAKIAQEFDKHTSTLQGERYTEEPFTEGFRDSIEWLRLVNACKWIAPKLRMGHESPFEHGIITFEVDRCSRSLTHQLVRHRIASFSQASQRYISESPNNLKFTLPKEILNMPEAFSTVMGYLNALPDCIDKLKELGIKNEDIRCIYPNAMSTNIQVSMNFRELKHFIELRLSKHAQDEIRFLAFRILEIISSKMPFIWNEVNLSI